MPPSKTLHLCFLVNVERWAMKVELTMPTPRVVSKAIIDYDSLPIKGHFRLSIKDLIKVCKEIRTKRYTFGASIDHNKAPMLATTPFVRLA